jgi:lysine 2,3-aminomutase
VPEQSLPESLRRTNWKADLRDSILSIQELERIGVITSEEAKRLDRLSERFKIRITRYYASLFTNTTNCPIKKQAIPTLGEKDPTLPAWAQAQSLKIYARPTPWHADPIGDVERLATPRLTHRYENRAILHLSTACAVHCRFCFRKTQLNKMEEYLYQGPLNKALEYLQKKPQISELILTGGDPLSISDESLSQLLDQIATIESIRTVRIHSRMPVTLPTRLTPDLVDALAHPRRFKISLVSHFNHPLELTTQACASLNRLAQRGVRLYNQSVLLAGVNNSVECLRDLFQGLYEAGVTPFYLHHPDWTAGTFHFRLSIEEGQNLVRKLYGQVSGPAIPQYVLDIPQGYGKIPLLDSRVKKLEEFRSEIGGAVYELNPPLTLSTKSNPETLRYLDLFPLQ